MQEIPDGDIRRVGVWLANQKQCRDRLDQAQRAALAELGVDWAGEG
uniref:Helicase n=1 Tax=Streptomyces sp. NBC_00049 TaxID=2903617 RepID=A0AAU2K5M3_9ACTN